MSTKTIYATASTDLDYYAQTSDLTSRDPLGDAVGMITNQSLGIKLPSCYPMMQFISDVSFSNKVISRVVLTVCILSSYDTYRSEIHVRSYGSAQTLDNVNWSNVGSYSALGTDKSVIYGAMSEASYHDIDITDIFLGALQDGTTFTCGVTGVAIWSSGSGHSAGASTLIAGEPNAMCPFITVEYEAPEQLPPTPAYPNGVTLREHAPLEMTWGWNSSSGAEQAAVTIQIKKGDGEWESTSLTQSSHVYAISNGFDVGSYQWKICGTNTDGEDSEYSSVATFTVIGTPSRPVIGDPENKALTKISWTASGQVVAEVELRDVNDEIIDHVTKATSDTTYRPQMFLSGAYTVGVRYAAVSGLWSEWAYKTFIIDADAPDAETITAVQSGKSVVLTFTHDEDSDLAIVRSADGVETVLAVLYGDETTYTDDTVAAGVSYSYKIRSFAGGYTDSDAATVNVQFSSTLIDDVELFESESLYAPYAETPGIDSVMMNYSGRDYGVVERGSSLSRDVQRSFHVSRAVKLRLEQLARLPHVFYRDNYGNAFDAAITGITYSAWRDNGYTVTFSLAQVDAVEVIINV